MDSTGASSTATARDLVEKREERLSHRREKERAYCASETAKEKDKWLRKRRARDQARWSAQSAEERDSRLQQVNAHQHERLATVTMEMCLKKLPEENPHYRQKQINRLQWPVMVTSIRGCTPAGRPSITEVIPLLHTMVVLHSITPNITSLSSHKHCVLLLCLSLFWFTCSSHVTYALSTDTNSPTE